MKKKTRTLVILLAVFVVLVGAYIGVSVYNDGQTQKTADQTRAAQIWSSDRGAPAGISYTTGGKTLSFKLTDSKWTAADGSAFPLDQNLLTGLASALKGLTAVRTIDTGSPLSVYGLDKPAYTVTAADSVGNGLTLLIGAQNGSNYYAMTKDGSKIYTISSDLAGFLKPDYLSFIAVDTVHSLTSTNVNTISLSSGKTSLNLDRHQNKDNSYTWFVVSGDKVTAVDEFVLPVKADKSPGKFVTDVVTALGSAYFSSCAAYKPTADELKTFGLDAQKLVVKVGWAETTGQGTLEQKTTTGTVDLEIGAKLPDGSGYYARLAGSDQVDVLPPDAVTPLLDALAALASGQKS